MSKLNERAMLVNLSIGYWDGRKRDKTTTIEVLEDTHAAEDAGVWWTRTIPKEIINRVLAARTAARTAHLRLTLPWANDGPRILPSALFMEYTRVMREQEQEFRRIADDFKKLYPTILKDAKARLGELADRVSLPSPEEVADKFRWSVRFMPLPDAGDFRIDLGADITREVKEDIERQVTSATELAMRSVWDRLHSIISKMAEKLSDSEAVFHKSMISNLIELCDILPALNVSGDERMVALREEAVSKLAGLDAQTLRDDETARRAAGDTAKDMLGRIEAAMQTIGSAQTSQKAKSTAKSTTKTPKAKAKGGQKAKAAPKAKRARA